MKKLILVVVSLVFISAIFGFTNIVKENPQTDPTYITVSYTNTSNRVYTYWGGDRFDEAKFKSSLFGKDEYRNKIVDVLNELHEKGYEVIDTDHLSYRSSNDFNVREYNYTLKKIEHNN